MCIIVFMMFAVICVGVQIGEDPKGKLKRLALAEHDVAQPRMDSKRISPSASVASMLLAMNPSVAFKPAHSLQSAAERQRRSNNVLKVPLRARAALLSDVKSYPARDGKNATSRMSRVLNRFRKGTPRKKWSERNQSWLARFRNSSRLGKLVGMVFLACALLFVRRYFLATSHPLVELTYAEFMKMVSLPNAHECITDMVVSPRRISFRANGQACFTRPVLASWDLVQMLSGAGINFRAAPTKTNIFSLLFPLAYLGFLFRMMNSLSGGPGKKNIGKKASSFRLSEDGLSFEDVAGIDVARGEVQEIVSMLARPQQYSAAGARLPSGVLMVGPPGTGKTLLARAMASQAGVPFYFCSGSDFVEIFVGRGAARMRELFKEAAKETPCLIFIDELDVLGKQRSLRITGSNDEIEQTLNQMLACMDGLDSSNNGIIVMGATNRYEILDPALTRPGRFDRIVRVDLPDSNGRLEILRVHTRHLQLDDDVDLGNVADLTSSYSGADLAALANEAAIRAVRRGALYVNMGDFLAAVDAFNQSRRRLPNVQDMMPEWMRNK